MSEVTAEEQKEYGRHVRRFRGKTVKMRDDELVELVAHLEVHPVCDALPKMADAEYEALVDSVRQSGLQDPIVFWDGKLIDGRHRLRACLEAKSKLKAVSLYDCSEAQAMEWVLGRHLGRRNLDDTQRALLMADTLIARVKASRLRKAKAKHVVVGTPGADEGGEPDLSRPEADEVEPDGPDLKALPKRPEHLPLKTADAARIGNVSAKAVERAVKIRLAGEEEINRELDKGDLTMHLSNQLARLPKERQREFVDLLKVERAKDATVKARDLALKFLEGVSDGELDGKPSIAVTMTFRTTDPRFFSEEGRPLKEKLNENLVEIGKQAEFLGFHGVKFAAKSSR